ncbi:MAG: hypothetical protein AB4290_31830 [Spirulina sp.]
MAGEKSDRRTGLDGIAIAMEPRSRSSQTSIEHDARVTPMRFSF